MNGIHEVMVWKFVAVYICVLCRNDELNLLGIVVVVVMEYVMKMKV